MFFHKLRRFLGMLIFIWSIGLVVLPLFADETTTTQPETTRELPQQITARLEDTTYLYYFESDDVLLDAATPTKRYSFGTLPDEEVTIVVYGLDNQVLPRLALYNEDGNFIRSGNQRDNPYITWIYQYKARDKALFYFDVTNMTNDSGLVRVMLFRGDPLTGNRTLLDRINPLLPGRAFMVAGEHPDPQIQGLNVAVEVLPVTRFEDIRPEVFASRGALAFIPAIEERQTPVTNRAWRNTPDVPIYTINVRAAPEAETGIEPMVDYVALNLNNFYFFDYHLIIGSGSRPELLVRGDDCQSNPNRPECIRVSSEPTGRSFEPIVVNTPPPAPVEIEVIALPLPLPALPIEIILPDVIDCGFDPTFFFGTFNGTPGDDSLGGSSCSDDLYGEAGDDILNAGPGFDNLYGGLGNDYMVGGGHDDRLFGGPGDDQLFGDDGNDFFEDWEGVNAIDGGANDPVVGFAGGDTITYVSAGESVTVDLAAGTAFLTASGTSLGTLTDIENIFGSATGNDILTGSAVANRIDPWGGDDTIDAGAGNDFILDYNGEGADVINGGADTDLVQFIGYGAITINYTGGGGGTTNFGDTLTGVENITTGGGTETFNITVDAENNIFDASTGTDVANYNGGGVTFDVSNVVTVTGGGGIDTLLNFETLNGSDAVDTVNVNNTTGISLTINTGMGDDTFNVVSDGITDTFDGGADVDTLNVFSGFSNYLYYNGAGGSFVNGDNIRNFENFNLGNNGNYIDVVTVTDGIVNNFIGGVGVDTLSYIVPQNLFVDYNVGGNGEIRDTNAAGALFDTFQNIEEIYTFNGTDTFSIETDAANNTFDARSGVDTATYDTNATAVQVNQVSSNRFTVTQGGTDTLFNFETFVGTAQDDTFNLINDTSNHTFDAGAGAADTFNIADSSRVVLTYNGGGTMLFNNASGFVDTLNNFEVYNFANFNDYVTLNAIDAQTGTINAGVGYDYLDVNIAATIDYAGFAAGTVTGGTGTATFTGMDSFYGSTADDTFTVAVDTNSNEFNGVEGVDSLDSTSTADTRIDYYGWYGYMTIAGTTDYLYNLENITTDAGNDVFNVLNDITANTFNADAGTDTLIYSGNAPAINIGAAVTITDGSPTDTYLNFETIRSTTTFTEYVIDTDSNTNYTIETVAGTTNNFRFIGNGTGTATIDIFNNSPGGDGLNFSTFTGGGVNINMGETTVAQNIFGTFQLFLRNAINRLTGSNQADNIAGSGGNDTINAGGGDDVVDAGAGNDNIDGQDGNDTLYGGMDNDTINGGNNNDIIYGGGVCGGAVAPPPGAIILGVPAASTDGGDTINGNAGDDTMYGGNDNSGAAVANNCNDNFDSITDTLGTDTLYGGNNNTGGGVGGDTFDVLNTFDFGFPGDTAVGDNSGFSGGGGSAFMNTDFFDATFFGNGP